MQVFIELFSASAGFLLGCAVKPIGYSGMSVQGLSSSLEQNLERQFRMMSCKDSSTVKGFACFCLHLIRKL